MDYAQEAQKLAEWMKKLDDILRDTGIPEEDVPLARTKALAAVLAISAGADETKLKDLWPAMPPRKPPHS